MNIEKYTERARGFIQSAQSLAMREGHQQFSTLHLLKVLLDDSEGLAGGLIDRAGGNSRAILKSTEEVLSKLPKVSGGGAGQIYLAPELARAFDAAEKAGEKAGDSFVTVERLLLGLTLEELSARCIQRDAEHAPSVSYLSMIESGKRAPSPEVLGLLAGVFQRSAAWFLDERADLDPAPRATPAGGAARIPLEPAFLFSKQVLQAAIPELLAQVETLKREGPHEAAHAGHVH